MTGSVALDVVIGLVFIYLLYSLLASIIQEIIATSLSFRAKILEKAIARMLQDEDKSGSSFKDRITTWIRLLSPIDFFNFLKEGTLSEAFYKHPLIKYLAEDKWHSKPSYITPTNFSKVIIDLLRGDDIKLGDDLKPSIEKSLQLDPESNEENSTHTYLKSLWIDAQGDVEKFKILLETWFNDTMARTSGWYKKYNQIVLFIIGLTIAIVFNVDSILITKKLSRDPEIRIQLVNQANNFIEAHPNLEGELRLEKAALSTIADTTEQSTIKLEELEKTYDSLEVHRDKLLYKADSILKNDIKNASDLLALGWTNLCDTKNDSALCNCGLRPNGDTTWYMHLIGWVLTALAISMGAPFWFDLLNKLMKLRGSLKTNVQEPAKQEAKANQINRVG